MDHHEDHVGHPPVVLSRKERNHIAALATNHMGWAGEELSPTFSSQSAEKERDNGSKVVVLFNLREDLGWQLKAKRGGKREWRLALCPPGQLRGLLRCWRKDETEQLVAIERGLAEALAEEDVQREAAQREEIAKTNTSLYRTCDLISRLDEELISYRLNAETSPGFMSQRSVA